MAESLTLKDRHWNVVVTPALGGCLQRCEFDGATVLQPTARSDFGDAQSWCYFPMIPFANRIENGRFDFAGARVQLPPNVAGTSHALHGHGWQTAWQVDQLSPSACSLSYRHEARADWPWRYEGRQSFEIDGHSLRITLAVQNLASKPMPCGLGFHPFFPAHGARLQLNAARMWKGSVREFPRTALQVPEPFCFGNGAQISKRIGMDHCFDGWQCRAVVSFEHFAHDLVIEGSEATDLVIVYIPQGASYFCVEPVTHAVNAMNLRDPAAAGWWTLAPSECREVEMSIRSAPRAC